MSTMADSEHSRFDLVVRMGQIRAGLDPDYKDIPAVIDEAVAMGAVFQVVHPPGSYLGSVGGLTCGRSLPLPGNPGCDERRDGSYRESPADPIPERRLAAGGHEAEHHGDPGEQVVGAVAAHDRESTHQPGGSTR